MRIKKIEKICYYYLNVFDENNIFFEYKKDIDSGIWYVKFFDNWNMFDDKDTIKLLEKEIVKDIIK